MGRWGYYEYFPPSRPKEVKGGIKAQSSKGNFGVRWWAKRWIAVLESFNIGARLGRSYARRGQVLSIAIEPGLVKAKVQGSRSKPYKIKIRIKPLSPQEWQKLTQFLSKQALFMAKLLAGEMPEDIEQAFQQVGLALFPQKHKDLVTDCSCPDWSNPCKHIAAVYYLLGEEFDRDPFLIFNLRGMGRSDLLTRLSADQPKTPEPKKARTKKTHVQEVSEPDTPSEPLINDPLLFWEGEAVPDTFFGEVRVPPVQAALPKRLGNFPFWRGESPFLSEMESIYGKAALNGLDVFLGQEKEAPGGSKEIRREKGLMTK
jgi:uncharacterized Zn finger protein